MAPVLDRARRADDEERDIAAIAIDLDLPAEIRSRKSMCRGSR
jgi:hypothetical protein